MSLLAALLNSTTSLALRSGQETFPSDSVGSIEIQGTKLDYIAQGRGKPCLVIGSSLYYPKTFSRNLRERFRLYFVDMRWFAKVYAATPLPSYTMDVLVADVDKIRRELKLEKVVLMGHSIHGAIAFEYAKRHPANVSHLILIGSPVILGNSEYEEEAAKMWRGASQERRELQDYNWGHLPDFKKFPALQPDIENYVAITPKYWYDPKYPARRLWDGMTINSDIFHHLYGDLFSNYRMFGAESAVPVPTFVALGRFDYVIPYSLWLRYKSIPNLTISLFDKSGHTPQLEEPKQFDKRLLEWIGRN